MSKKVEDDEIVYLENYRTENLPTGDAKAIDSVYNGENIGGLLIP